MYHPFLGDRTGVVELITSVTLIESGRCDPQETGLLFYKVRYRHSIDTGIIIIEGLKMIEKVGGWRGKESELLTNTENE
jgi:hypothetical protein